MSKRNAKRKASDAAPVAADTRPKSKKRKADGKSKSRTADRKPAKAGVAAVNGSLADMADLKAAVQARSGVEARRKREPVEEAPPVVIGKGRKGRKAIVVYLHPYAKDLLERIGGEQKRSVQDLGIEAINLLFRSYGEKPIA